jgi:hypothetical protein
MRLKLAFIAIALAVFFFFILKNEDQVDFNTQVKPLLNQKCMSCHGGVKKKGGFSLLTREDALAATESGQPAIVPGHAAKSEFIRRLSCQDEEERMPYRKEPLKPAEIALLTQWVDQGAQWGTHWAYTPVREPIPPSGYGHGIDAFVRARLQAEGLKPAPKADKTTLIRRLSLDLIGLPPDPGIQQRFLNDSSAFAYERLVDTLLNSPQYGERWASVWLDLARYADSKGYERDARRFAWRYRDWLIRAFNRDMPYDQFLTEQLAGDLLPNPMNDQLVATQFHRNTPTNDEGGTDNEEFRVAAVLDRVNTTWEALMGTSFACVQCHSHPYDPFFHDEYYQFAAFFNNSRDADTYEDYPLIRWYSPEDSVKLEEVKDWLLQNAPYEAAEPMIQLARLWQPVWYSIGCDQLQNSALSDTKWLVMSHVSSARLPAVTLDGHTRLILRYQGREAGGSVKIHLDQLDGPVLLEIPIREKTNGWAFQKIDFQGVAGKHDLYLSYQNKALAKKPEVFGVQFDWFAFTQPFPGQGKTGHAEMEKKWFELISASCETSPCMWENPPEYQRPTQVFERGNWRVPGKTVQAAVPSHMPSMPSNAPANRLGLAQWMTAPTHPLTSRVLVNRLWEQLFGIGLVETAEDFGSQGAGPSHPELLDWLAWRMMHEHHWSIKKALKEIVLSETYQQASQVQASNDQDPTNRWLSRGPKVRLQAEQIRDQTLALSGLLSDKMYGKPVMPYQPEGVWNTPWNDDAWKTSGGENRYRRAVYTFWKRSSPYPSMMAFDGVSREVCSARRVRTNTPIQALVTLNDPVYMEAAVYFARRVRKIVDTKPLQQIQTAYLLATGKSISIEKEQILLDLYQKSVQTYQSNPESTHLLLNDLPCDEVIPETAALAIVANVLLNLDEVVTKQ